MAPPERKLADVVLGEPRVQPGTRLAGRALEGGLLDDRAIERVEAGAFGETALDLGPRRLQTLGRGHEQEEPHDVASRDHAVLSFEPRIQALPDVPDLRALLLGGRGNAAHRRSLPLF